jgi:multiple sugar transport system permease protein
VRHERAAAQPTRLRVGRIGALCMRQACVVALALIITFPFLWLLSVSVSPASEVFAWPPRLIPSVLRFQNYADAIVEYDFLRYFWNSLIVAVIATGCVMIFDSMAGFAFAHLPFRGIEAIYLGIVVTIMIPMQITMIPLFVIMKHIPLLGGNDLYGNGGKGLVDSYGGLIIPWMATTFGTMLMREYFRMLPKDLLDAARLDGLNEFQIFWKVYLPLAKPALTSVAVLTFTEVWNTFLWPLIITNSAEMRTVQTGLASIKSQYFTDWHLLMAANIVSCLPVLVVYFVGQKHFVRGIAMSGIKG